MPVIDLHKILSRSLYMSRNPSLKIMAGRPTEEPFSSQSFCNHPLTYFIAYFMTVLIIFKPEGLSHMEFLIAG